tara:strand:+ start:6434 stop:6535 length:102 start_codon:yes stop_codon:yes gene_type:complete
MYYLNDYPLIKSVIEMGVFRGGIISEIGVGDFD